jgi:hypothetical protein
MSTRIVEVRAKVMKQNDLLAHALRKRFEDSGVSVVGLVSSLAPARPHSSKNSSAVSPAIIVLRLWSAISPRRMMPHASSAPRPTSARSLPEPSAISTRFSLYRKRRQSRLPFDL